MLAFLQTKEIHRIHINELTNSTRNLGNDPFLKRLWERKEIPQNKFKFQLNNGRT